MNWKTKVSELTVELAELREELASLSKEHESLKSELEVTIRKQKEAEKNAAASNHYAVNHSCWKDHRPVQSVLDDPYYQRPMQSVSEAMHWIRSTNGHGRSDKERLNEMLTERARGNRCYINDHGELRFPDDCGF